jgi:hypothetical protein
VDGTGWVAVPVGDDLVDKFGAVIARKLCFRWNSRRGKGRVAWMSLRESKVQRWALLRRENRQIQPEATSVAVRVRIYWPEVVCPQ